MTEAWRVSARLCAAVLFAGTMSAAAQAMELGDFVGEWRGTGQFERITRQQRSGRLTCRLTITQENASAILIKGRCAAPEGSRGFTTRVTRGEGASVTGEALRAGARRGRRSTGVLDENGFALAGDDIFGSFSFALTRAGPDAIEMRSSADENDKREAARVILRRRP